MVKINNPYEAIAEVTKQYTIALTDNQERGDDGRRTAFWHLQLKTPYEKAIESLLKIIEKQEKNK